MKKIFLIAFVGFLSSAQVFAQAERMSLRESMMAREEAKKKVKDDHQKIRADRVANESKAMQDANQENLRQDRQRYREQKAKDITNQTEQGIKDVNERGRQGRP